MHSGTADTAAGPVTFWAPPPAVLEQSSRMLSRKSRVFAALEVEFEGWRCGTARGGGPPKTRHPPQQCWLDRVHAVVIVPIPQRTSERMN